MSPLAQAALELASKGYYVFPLHARLKTPATGRGFKDATRDPDTIGRWWTAKPGANIGVACGSSGVVVLDIDTKAGADPRKILAQVDRMGAPIVSTGVAPEPCSKHPDSLAGRRGAQVYFRGSMSSTKRLEIAGCEIKGAGGYVVAPPSIHPSRVEYVGDLPPVDELPPVPGWLSALVLKPVQKAPRRSAAPRTSGGDVLDAIDPPTYVEALTGSHVPANRVIECPLLDHDDGTPSFHVYPDAQRGWYCFGCDRGGTIYDLGAALWGTSTRGVGFHELRKRLAQELLGSLA